MTDIIHIQAIWRLNQAKLQEDIKQHAIDWTTQKKCDCLAYDGELIVCEHVQRDRRKKFGKRIGIQFTRANNIGRVALERALQRKVPS